MVTWEPDAAVIARLESVAAQVGSLIVIDNGSRPVVIEPIRSWADDNGARFIRNEKNRGVAAAYNQGAHEAVSGGSQWLLVVDQDTVVSSTLVADLLAARAAHPSPDLIAVIGPVTNRQSDRRCTDRAWVRRRLVISSGSLLSLAAWSAVGGFREDYFVDMVEAEYCLRLGTRGYAVILACRAQIDHRIGSPTKHRLLGREVSTSNHPAYRRYYLMRNRLNVWRAYWRYAPAWVAFDVKGHIRDTIFMALFEPGRRQKLSATAAGFRDGVLGRTGERVTPPVVER